MFWWMHLSQSLQLKKQTQQAVYIWNIKGDAVAEFCVGILPYMRLKREQYVLAASWPTGNLSGPTNVCATSNLQTIDFASAKECAKYFRISQSGITSYFKGKNVTALAGWILTKPVQDRSATFNARLKILELLKQMKTLEHQAVVGSLSLPYFAGFFDADGCIVLHCEKHIYVSVSQKYRVICDSFQAKFGGGVYVDKRNNQFKWKLSSRPECLEFLRVVHPYLIEKQEQAMICSQTVLSSTDILRFTDLHGYQSSKKRATLNPIEHS